MTHVYNNYELEREVHKVPCFECKDNVYPAIDFSYLQLSIS